MNRYSRFCQVSRNDSGASTQELGSSQGLNTFMRQLGIMNLQEGFDAVARDLADFRKLSEFGELPDRERPMLIRYSPIELSKRPGWARDVKSFLALCGSGLDSTGNMYHHTCFFRSDLLLKDDVFNYLDHLFGTHFAGPEGIEPGDLERDPDRVEPVQRPEDALVVKLAAAALLQNRPIVLKLEKDCVFNRRAMDLLSQIYSLLPPELAVQTGYSSYQDPLQLEDLLRSTPIRIFLTHADCVCSAGDPRFLFFDLNQPVNIQAAAQQSKGFLVSKNLFTYITYWHSMPWRERQPLMKLLFCDIKDLPNEQIYCAVTRNFVQDPFIQWINRLPDSATYTTLEQLKEKYDSFPICGQVPILREKFCLTVPQLLKPPLTLDTLGNDLRLRLNKTPKDVPDYDRLRELNDFFQLLQPVCAASDARRSQMVQEPDQIAAEPAALQEAHARQIRELEQAFSDQVSQLKAEKQALRTAYEQERMSLEQEISWKLHEAEQSFASQLSRLEAENQALQKAHQAELAMLVKQLDHLHTENHSLRKSCDELSEDLHRVRESAREKATALAELQQKYDNVLAELTELESNRVSYHARANADRQLLKEELAAMEEKYKADILKADTAWQQMMDQREHDKKAYEATIHRLTQKHENELAEMEEKCKADILKADTAWQQMMDQQEYDKQAYKATIHRLTQKHENELAEMEEKYKADILKADTAWQQMMDQQEHDKQAYEAAIRRQKQLHEEELAEARAKYQHDIEQVNAAIRRLTQDHENELTEAKARYHTDMAQANEAIRHLTRAHTEELAAMEDKYKADITYANESIRRVNEERAELSARCLHLEHQLDIARNQPATPSEGTRGHWWKK